MFDRVALMGDPCGIPLPLSAQKEVHCLSRFVYGSVQINPFAAHLDVGLIHPPRAAHRADVLLPPLPEFRRVMLHPSQNRRVRQADAALAHHADQIPIAQFETQVPPNAQHHNLGVQMAACKQLLDGNESGHSLIFAHPEKLAPEPFFVLGQALDIGKDLRDAGGGGRAERDRLHRV